MRLFILFAILAASCSAFKPNRIVEPVQLEPTIISGIQFYDEFRDTAFIPQSDAPGARMRLEGGDKWELVTDSEVGAFIPEILQVKGVDWATKRTRYSASVYLSPAFYAKDVLKSVMAIVNKSDTTRLYDMVLPFGKTDSTVAFEVGIYMNDTMSVQMRSGAKAFTVKTDSTTEKIVKFELQIDPNMVEKTFKNSDWAYLITDGTGCSSPTYGVSLCFQGHVLNFAPDGSATVDGRLMYKSFPVYLSMVEWATKQKQW